jgi:hypothetical protein
MTASDADVAVSLHEVILNASHMVGAALGGPLPATGWAGARCGVNAASYRAPLLVLLIHKPAYVTAAPGGTTARKGRTFAGLRDWRAPSSRRVLVADIA